MKTLNLLKKMKRCELCKSMATIYCESDSASLCWNCDAKVHSANFLVARHSRSLLCQICQSPTPWSASGKKLCPSSASICGKCVFEDVSDDNDDRDEKVGGNDEYDGGECSDELQLKDLLDKNGNQNVPPPPATSSSSSEGFSISNGGVLLKRKRQFVVDLTSEDDVGSSSVNINPHTPEPSSEATGGKLKIIRQQSIFSGDNISSPVVGTSKSRRIFEFDLNSPP